MAKYGAGEGKALFNLGNVYLTASDREKAISYYQKAREVFIRFGMDGYELLAKHQIASTSVYLGRVQFAEAELRMIAQEYKKRGDLVGEYQSYVDLVNVSLVKLDFIEAINRGVEILPKVDDAKFSYLQVHLRQLLVIAHLRLGQVESAEKYFQFFADEWADQRPGFVFIPAHMLQAKGQFDEALVAAQKIKQQLGDDWLDGHEAVLKQFKESKVKNKIIPINY